MVTVHAISYALAPTPSGRRGSVSPTSANRQAPHCLRAFTIRISDGARKWRAPKPSAHSRNTCLRDAAAERRAEFITSGLEVERLTREEARRGPVRTIQDEVGTQWRVWERSDTHDRSARPSLVFESDAAIRRVREYLENWFQLTDAELYAISFHR